MANRITLQARKPIRKVCLELFLGLMEEGPDSERTVVQLLELLALNSDNPPTKLKPVASY